MKTRLFFCLVLAAGTALAQTQSASPNPHAQQPASPAPAAPAAKPSGAPSAQTGQKAPSAVQKPEETAPVVAPAQAVITIRGLCAGATKTASGKTAGAGACTTVVTKEQFDRLVEAVSQPGQSLPPQMRQRLAQSYVELLAFANAAKKAGVEKSQSFQEQVRLIQLQTLARVYQRDLQTKYGKASAQEIEAYYQENLPKFEEVKLRRIFIPKNNPAAQNKEESDKKAPSAAEATLPKSNPAALSKEEYEKKAPLVAVEIRDRAAKGEDLEQLQKEAYTTLGLTTPPMNTDMGKRRRGMLPQQLEEEIFALKPGEVSKVDAEPSGYVFYKVESRQTLPLDQVKDQISRDLGKQRLESKLKEITGAVKPEFNEKYFGPAAAAPISPAALGGTKRLAAPPVAPPVASPAAPSGAKPPTVSTPPGQSHP